MRQSSRWNKLGVFLVAAAVMVSLYGFTQLNVTALPALTRDDRLRSYTVYAVSTEEFDFKVEGATATLTKRDNRAQVQLSTTAIPGQTLGLFLAQFWNAGAVEGEYVPKSTCRYLYLYLTTPLLKPSDVATLLPLERLACRTQLYDSSTLEPLPLHED